MESKTDNDIIELYLTIVQEYLTIEEPSKIVNGARVYSSRTEKIESGKSSFIFNEQMYELSCLNNKLELISPVSGQLTLIQKEPEYSQYLLTLNSKTCRTPNQ